MTVKGGTSQACAACKYQRRKCAADCPLAPYFPPDQPKMFQNAHRLFGVANIHRILKQLTPTQKNDAMGSIIFQSNMREKFPVHGCYGYICQLRFQIEQYQQELHAVQTQLALYHHHLSSSSPPHPSSQLQLGMAATSPSPNTLSLFHQSHLLPLNAMPINGISPAPTNNLPSFSSGTGNSYMDSKDNISNHLWIQNQNSSCFMSQTLPILQDTSEEAPREYDEIAPFFDTIDDRQSYMDSKDAYDSSPEDSLKTTQAIQHVDQDNELKSAAACFSFARLSIDRVEQ
ncbi:hypothetical protein NE237_005696 [Protea cynaroides]|uniref:LOB domain-containing protein n=1 Tax=Protea cynaroides TaxID=273540 RepID=A0A9Q0QUR1_9MAGN|nr:hypothetical protein NE237_005696 [Protea cynaroides]